MGGVGVGTLLANRPNALARCHTPPGIKPGPFDDTVFDLADGRALDNGRGAHGEHGQMKGAHSDYPGRRFTPHPHL